MKLSTKKKKRLTYVTKTLAITCGAMIIAITCFLNFLYGTKNIVGHFILATLINVVLSMSCFGILVLVEANED